MLDCSASSGSRIACTGPPNSSIAPPGQYMLFAVSDGVPSIAPYVSLQTDSLESGAQFPVCSSCPILTMVALHI